MAKIKTTETVKSVTDFINAIVDETKRKDSFSIIKIMQVITGLKPKMWGPSMIGFDSYHYKYESGHEGDMFKVGFAPRASAIVLYIPVSPEKREDFLKELGKHKTGKGCIYIKKLDDINVEVLKKMVGHGMVFMKAKYPDEKGKKK